jgi:acyl CoA:acetate/3-ketoacid CoA transferase beta subunit
VTDNKISLEEQIVSQIARCFRPDEEVAASGALTSAFVGIALAQRLYAPGIVIYREAFGRSAHMSNLRLAADAGDSLADSVEALLDFERVWELVFGGRWVMFMQPVQIDRFGNANLSVVGDKYRPNIAFVGSRGLPDNTVNCERVYYIIPEHTKRVFVEHVDFISGLGHGAARRALGINRGAPHLVFTNLGVFDFDDSGQMRIKSIHSGAKLEDVLQNTGFDLIIPASVPGTPRPTEKESRLIREEIDPLGMSRLDFAKGPAYQSILEQIKKGRRETG